MNGNVNSVPVRHTVAHVERSWIFKKVSFLVKYVVNLQNQIIKNYEEMFNVLIKNLCSHSRFNTRRSPSVAPFLLVFSAPLEALIPIPGLRV